MSDEDILFCELLTIKCIKHIADFLIIRYINLSLLTYLLTHQHCHYTATHDITGSELANQKLRNKCQLPVTSVCSASYNQIAKIQPTKCLTLGNFTF